MDIKFNSLKEAVKEIIKEKKPIVISDIAGRCGVSELEACRALPEDIRSFASKDKFDEIWKELVSWEAATFIVVHKGSAIEIKCRIPEGSYGHGFFNIHGDSPLGGHIKASDIETICFASIPFMGLESHSVQFYNKTGGLMFSIYAGRQNRQLIPSVKESFLAMKEKYGSMPFPERRSLIVYSSKTGNTKMIAEAIGKVIPNCEIYPVENAPEPDDYAFVSVGYWVDKGLPDAKAKKYIESINNANVALFGTLGAWPDSDHAKECIAKSEAILTEKGKENNVLGSFLCQGKVDPELRKRMAEAMGHIHPMTPERIARLKEAEKHPDEADCARAAEMFKDFAERLGL